ncbi:flavin-containing monooxygenase [Streptomyces sp. URMC 126]|uniref:flavin-containing monooxygenase n=1 Tax=Streptomyces sp. URMC 126 TaxID=3423401 RepID=UPI003F1AB8E5
MRIVIVGAGFGGIGAAVELRRHGFRDFVLLEAARRPGGTWHHNDYPGAACDVPSHLYSYSYAQEYPWPRWFAAQPDILDYLLRVARDFGVSRHIVTGTTVTACRWDDATLRWTVCARSGDGRTSRWRADALVLATGQLDRPALPEFDGMSAFRGNSFHSARWDHGFRPQGRRVAVVGTGASAAQFVPELAPAAERLTVFQRTGNWFLPRRDRPCPAALRTLFREVPAARAAWRSLIFHGAEALTLAIRHPATAGRAASAASAAFMRYQLPDPRLRRRAWPAYPFGCKRVLFSSSYLPTLARPNVELVTAPIVRMTARGPQTSDGRTHPADCVVYATGFTATDFLAPMDVTGAGGLPLRVAWAGGAHAHLGIMVPGFPSMFLMYGPNTNTSGGSVVHFLEAQARWIRQALEYLRDRGGAALDVRAEVEAAANRALQERFTGTAWGGCASWYRDRNGRFVTNWPGCMGEYARRTRRFDPADFRLTTRRTEA